MQTGSQTHTGWRGSRDVWLRAAYDRLVESGVDSVRIQALADTLRLSRTSFYWFFRDREALLAALLGLWRDRNAGIAAGQCADGADTLPDVLRGCLDDANFDPVLERAVRSWAMESEDVAREVAAADVARLAGLVEAFGRFGFSTAEADVRARATYCTLIGDVFLRAKGGRAHLAGRLADFARLLAGAEDGPHRAAEAGPRRDAACAA